MPWLVYNIISWYYHWENLCKIGSSKLTCLIVKKIKPLVTGRLSVLMLYWECPWWSRLVKRTAIVVGMNCLLLKRFSSVVLQHPVKCKSLFINLYLLPIHIYIIIIYKIGCPHSYTLKSVEMIDQKLQKLHLFKRNSFLNNKMVHGKTIKVCTITSGLI